MNRLQAFALFVACVAIACNAKPHTRTATRPPAPTTVTTTAAPASGAGNELRIAVIVMENHEADAITGNQKARFLNDLAAHNAVATNWFAISHPSLPNYLALVAGSTLGVTNDCVLCNQSAPNLADQLESRGLSWKAYQQDIPDRCFTGGVAGKYAKKHNPLAYFTQISRDPARCRRIAGFDTLTTDERLRALPNFSFITPNLCNDTHDCGIDKGDAFLSRTVPPLLDALGPQGLLVVTYDEGATNAGCCGVAAGGRVFTIFAGPLAAKGARIDEPLTHYSLLRTVEDLFRLPHLGQAGCTCTKPAASLLLTP